MIALYIHWPFCISKCPYCDFNSHVRESVDHHQWQTALLTELRYYAEKSRERKLKSIFFGGGTPSLMDPSVVQTLIDEARSLWVPATDLEITLEANPGTVDSECFQAFFQAGINRLSLGVQSLHDDQLKFLGRKHSAEEALKAILIARDTFPRYSFDLIYARPQQTLQEWETELTQALTLAGDHLSLYQLTIEQGTAFYTQHNRGDFQTPEEDLAADFYTLTEGLMAASGRPAYEVSNYARHGQESQHNLVYWRYEDYVGIGPGAHGRFTWGGKKVGTRGIRAPELWLEQVKSQGHGTSEVVDVTRDEQIQEFFLMGLRLIEGVSVEGFDNRFGVEFRNTVNMDILKKLSDQGFLKYNGKILSTTLKGRLCLNKVLESLVI